MIKLPQFGAFLESERKVGFVVNFQLWRFLNFENRQFLHLGFQLFGSTFFLGKKVRRLVKLG